MAIPVIVAVLDQDRTFIHRDFDPGNVLSHRRTASGLVDWEAASVGARSMDIARCRMNVQHGVRRSTLVGRCRSSGRSAVAQPLLAHDNVARNLEVVDNRRVELCNI